MIAHFDNIVIGAGQSGPFLAMRLAKRGETTAIIERRALGGTCVNTGCTPTKTLRKSARVAYISRRAGEFGVKTGGVSVDFAAAMSRMQQRADEARTGLESWIRGEAKVSVFDAHGRIDGKDGEDFVVRIDGATVRGRRLFLNTGTRPFIPPISGLAETPHLTNESLLKLRALPDRLAIIGGGYIGLEFAQIFSRLGAKVVVIEPAARLVPREDEDISSLLYEMLQDERIEIICNAKVSATRSAANGVAIELADRTVEASSLLVATGRTPNTDNLGLETIGVALDERGYVLVNDRLETQANNVWALGDINRRGAFTHTSYHDFELVADNLEGAGRSVANRPATYSMFTDPPLAHVGIYERDARALAAQGRNISMASIDMANVSRAKEESETIGCIKIFIDEDRDRFLGMGMLGINADEIMHIFANLMATDGSVAKVRNTLPAHPTVAEFIPTILAGRKKL